MKNLEKLYNELRDKYGSPKGQWSLWCKRPKTNREREEVLVGAILTQRTNWNNVDLALDNLKRAQIASLRSIYQSDFRKLGTLIKPSGFYKTKAKYLFGLAEFIIRNYGGLDEAIKEDEKRLRRQLLELKGIGPETADSILLYALDKPIFVIDEYTRRLVKRRGLAENLNYDFLQKLFEKNLEKDFRLYQDFHALVVIDGKSQK